MMSNTAVWFEEPEEEPDEGVLEVVVRAVSSCCQVGPLRWATDDRVWRCPQCGEPVPFAEGFTRPKWPDGPKRPT